MVAGEQGCRSAGAIRRTALIAVALVLAACHATVPATSIPKDAGLAESGVLLRDGRRLANLSEEKRRIVEFHRSGEWEEQISALASDARERLDRELESASRPAIVLDVDDTALSTYAMQRQVGFGWMPELWDEWVEAGVAPPHAGVLDLYRHARARGVAVFFVTGRREHLREATERQLEAAGYERWDALYLKPEAYTAKSTAPWKTEVRRALEEQGFEILLNVGDQWSDLEGGFSRATYKLPNPMYYRP